VLCRLMVFTIVIPCNGKAMHTHASEKMAGLVSKVGHAVSRDGALSQE